MMARIMQMILGLRAGLAWFARGAAGAGKHFGLRRFGCGLQSRVPIEQAVATVAAEQLALAELVPGLRAHAHAAGGALLVYGKGDGGAARGGDSVEAGEPFGFDSRAENISSGIECGEFGQELLLARGHAG